MNKNIPVSKILFDCANLKNEKKQIEYLQQWQWYPILKDIIGYIYDYEMIKFDITPEQANAVEYKPKIRFTLEDNLLRFGVHLKYIIPITHRGDDLTLEQKIVIFRSLLEKVAPEEAKFILEYIIPQKRVSGLTAETIVKAFGQIISPNAMKDRDTDKPNKTKKDKKEEKTTDETPPVETEEPETSEDNTVDEKNSEVPSDSDIPNAETVAAMEEANNMIKERQEKNKDEKNSANKTKKEENNKK